MHTYQYQPGDRPLEGYTIKSAAGHGGFGEVYYAVSDSGREVALKAVQGYEQIELRGISQCMNLKSPHLVTIFDVKHNDQGRPFVLMEYVAGPSLADLIDQSPQGLGPQKTAFFLREIAKGLSYLHDCGIVHRDLKPANIFYENGYVKIGDYGLSKAISADHHQSQTVTVGTVHYMAPEVGAGRYDRSIDIYAMGVVVYEMLTGRVPFRGDTPSEILMKHLSSQPDLNDIEEPFREAIKGAMAKDPRQRYQSVNEMVQTVFGEERMKQSMAGYSGADLSMVAAQVAQKVRVGGAGDSSSADDMTGRLHERLEQVAGEVGRRIDRVGRKIDQKLSSKRVGPEAGQGKVADPACDPMSVGQRRTLSTIALLAVAMGTGMLAGSGAQQEWMSMLFAFTAAAGAVNGLLIGQKRLVPSLVDEPAIIRRVTVAGMAIFCSGLIALPAMTLLSGNWDSRHTMTLMTLAVPLFLIDWSKKMAPGRAQRLSFGSAISAGFLAWIASWFVDDMSSLLAIGIPAAVMLSIQAFSPFDPTVTERWVLDDDDNGKDQHKQPRNHVRPAGHNQGKRVAMHTTEQVNAYSAVVTANTSPKSRLITLLLALAPFAPFFGICGLHRFYVGKIWTGLLWFFTLGLLGIGQFIDVILILCGVFRDASGRPVKVWTYDSPQRYPGHPPAAYQHPAGVVQTAPPPPSFLGVVLSMMGSLLILIGLTLGLGLTLHVPEAIASGAVVPGLAGEITGLLGYEGWPSLFMDLGQVGAGVTMLIGGLLLMLARRNNGRVHMFRAGIATLVLIFFVPIFGPGLAQLAMEDRWLGIVDTFNHGQAGPAVEMLIQSFNWPGALFLGIVVLASVLTLAWPPRQKTMGGAPPTEEGA